MNVVVFIQLLSVIIAFLIYSNSITNFMFSNSGYIEDDLSDTNFMAASTTATFVNKNDFMRLRRL